MIHVKRAECQECHKDAVCLFADNEQDDYYWSKVCLECIQEAFASGKGPWWEEEEYKEEAQDDPR